MSYCQPFHENVLCDNLLSQKSIFNEIIILLMKYYKIPMFVLFPKSLDHVTW